MTEERHSAFEAVYKKSGDIIADVERVPNGVEGTLVINGDDAELQDIHRGNDPGSDVLPSLLFCPDLRSTFDESSGAHYRRGQIANLVG